MENAGVITAIAEKGIEMVDGDSHLITFLILLLSGVASAFVDNIPFTATMIPLIQDMQSLMNLPHADYMWWALATGACFGGNGTMIGASPNVIMVAIAAKRRVQYQLYRFYEMVLSADASVSFLWQGVTLRHGTSFSVCK